MEVARNSDLTPDEVFRRLASLPREMVMDEASRLVDMTSPSLKGPWALLRSPGGSLLQVESCGGTVEKVKWLSSSPVHSDIPAGSVPRE